MKQIKRGISTLALSVVLAISVMGGEGIMSPGVQPTPTPTPTPTTEPEPTAAMANESGADSTFDLIVLFALQWLT